MTPNGELTDGNPVSQTITSSAASPLPAIAYGQMANLKAATVSPRTHSPAMTELTTGDVFHYAHYKIYATTDSPADHTYDMDDEGGSNLLQSGYLELTE